MTDITPTERKWLDGRDIQAAMCDEYFAMPHSVESNPYMGNYMYMADYKRWRDMHEPDYFDTVVPNPNAYWLIMRHIGIVFILLALVINHT
jgi:hypothetical protein